jgi:hypothetical protein
VPSRTLGETSTSPPTPGSEVGVGGLARGLRGE